MESSENKRKSDGFFKTFFSHFFSIVYLNLLWIVFCIPIVTIGASTTAMYYATNKVIRNYRSYVFREFWNGFKENFKQFTLLWILYVLIVSVLVADIKILPNMNENFQDVLLPVFIVLMVILSAIFLLSLFYMARFMEKIRRIVGNCARLSICHLPCTLLMIVVTVVMAAIICYFPISIILAPGCAMLIENFIWEKVFRKYMSEEDLQKEEMRNHPEQYEYLQEL